MSWSGVILILVGAVLLANNFGLLEWGWMRQWWPAFLIALGVWSVLRPRRGDRHPSRRGDPGP